MEEQHIATSGGGEALAEFKNDIGRGRVEAARRRRRCTGGKFAAGRSLVMCEIRPLADFRQRGNDGIFGSGRAVSHMGSAAAGGPVRARRKNQRRSNRLADDMSPGVRAAVHRAKFANDSGDPNQLAEAMLDPESDIVLNAIRRISRDTILPGSDAYNRLVRLANDPDNAVEAQGRHWIPSGRLRPMDPAGRARFDLASRQPPTSATRRSLRRSKPAKSPGRCRS